MRVHSNPVFSVALLAVAIAFVGCGNDGGTILSGPSDPSLPGSADLAPRSNFGSTIPPFDPEDFVSKIDNPYFPLDPGTVYSYAGETDAGFETIRVEVTRDKKSILGVSTTVVHDRVLLDGELHEDTFDWYAQDEDGNVWYFGEDVKNYEGGVVVSTTGSWTAGLNGATAGIIMEAIPRVGDSYEQEHAAGVAEDMARVVSLKKKATVPEGSFPRCLQTVEWTPLEPGVRAYKFYARGVGAVLETTPGGERIELIDVED